MQPWWWWRNDRAHTHRARQMGESCCSPHVAHVVMTAAHGLPLHLQQLPTRAPGLCYLVTFLWLVLSITTDFAIEAQIWVLGKYGKPRRGGQKLPERGSWGSSSEPRPRCRTGDGRGWGSILGAASLEGNSCPAAMTGKEDNSSCSSTGNQLGIEGLVLCLWERLRVGNAHKVEKINGITRQRVLVVITTPTFMVSG